MTRLFRLSAAAATALLFVACSSGPPAASTPAGPSAASVPPASAPAGPTATAASSAPAAGAGEPCSFLTAQQVAAVLGTTPVEVAERVGRGDCDYWLTAAKESKVNIGVFTGAEATSYFETTKGIGTPQPVSVGDDAYSIYNESIGTVVVAKKGDTVVAVQVVTGTLPADQLRQATALVEAVLAGR